MSTREPSTHWTTRTMAEQVGVGKDTVAQIWADHQLKPWRMDAFELSNDPEFESKLVGLQERGIGPIRTRADLVKPSAV